MGNINHNMFIAEMIRFASENENPDVIINKLLQFICDNLKSDRAYIFEENEKGSFDNTYEICKDGIEPQIDILRDVPYEGVVEFWYREYESNKNIVIKDIEAYKDVCPEVYDVLKPQGVNTLVTGAIYMEGKIIGFYGVDNPPAEIAEEISILIDVIQFVIAMMLRIRNNARELDKKSWTDELTQCFNRKALKYYYDVDIDGSISVLACDLNGLKVKNDTEGHEAGDDYIRNLANTMKECFGDDKVYRIGGDEFVAVMQGLSLFNAEALLEEFDLKCKERNISVAFGLEHKDIMDITFAQLMKAADNKMFDSKRTHYSSLQSDKRTKKEVKNDILNNLLYDALSDASEYVYMYVLDVSTGISRWSKNCVDYFGMPGEYMENADDIWLEHIHPDDREIFLDDFSRLFTGKSDRHSCQYRARNCYGDYVWVECKGKIVKAANGNDVFAGMMTRLDNQSIYDPLTGLKTKNQFYDYDFNGEKGVVILIGIDYFKKIVNTYGYEVGDDVLVKFGKTFQNMNQKGIKAFRFNGDEFVFIIPNGTVEEAKEFFESINEKVGVLVLDNGQQINVSFSAGAVEYPFEGENTDRLVNRLEVSLAHVKKENRGCIAFYSEEIIARERRLSLLKKDLRDCIADNFKGFELFYQPWMNKRGEKIVGCEALLRWKGNMVKDSYPGEFIPILEETEDIIEVGRFVMREAIKQQKIWEEKYGSLLVSFNVSYRQFLEDNYVSEVIEAAKEFGVNPNNMVIELTESCGVQSPDILASVFAELRHAGFRLALDDFGTGYSSLELIKKLPSDGIKIEHNFVRELSKEGHDVDFAIIKSILFLCDELGQYVVVEGVENEEVDSIIRGMDAGFLQGYYYSKPVCVNEFEKYIEDFDKLGIS